MQIVMFEGDRSLNFHFIHKMIESYKEDPVKKEKYQEAIQYFTDKSWYKNKWLINEKLRDDISKLFDNAGYLNNVTANVLAKTNPKLIEDTINRYVESERYVYRFLEFRTVHNYDRFKDEEELIKVRSAKSQELLRNLKESGRSPINFETMLNIMIRANDGSTSESDKLTQEVFKGYSKNENGFKDEVKTFFETGLEQLRGFLDKKTIDRIKQEDNKKVSPLKTPLTLSSIHYQLIKDMVVYTQENLSSEWLNEVIRRANLHVKGFDIPYTLYKEPKPQNKKETKNLFELKEETIKEELKKRATFNYIEENAKSLETFIEKVKNTPEYQQDDFLKSIMGENLFNTVFRKNWRENPSYDRVFCLFALQDLFETAHDIAADVEFVGLNGVDFSSALIATQPEKIKEIFNKYYVDSVVCQFEQNSREFEETHEDVVRNAKEQLIRIHESIDNGKATFTLQGLLETIHFGSENEEEVKNFAKEISEDLSNPESQLAKFMVDDFKKVYDQIQKISQEGLVEYQQKGNQFKIALYEMLNESLSYARDKFDYNDMKNILQKAQFKIADMSLEVNQQTPILKM